MGWPVRNVAVGEAEEVDPAEAIGEERGNPRPAGRGERIWLE